MKIRSNGRDAHPRRAGHSNADVRTTLGEIEQRLDKIESGDADLRAEILAAGAGIRGACAEVVAAMQRLEDAVDRSGGGA